MLMSSNTCTMNVRIGRRGKQGFSDSKQTYVPCPRGEGFPGYTELLFDPLGAAEGAANFSVGEILNPQRMARLEVFGSMGTTPTWRRLRTG